MSSLDLALLIMAIPVVIVGIIVYKFLKSIRVFNVDFDKDDDNLL